MPVFTVLYPIGLWPSVLLIGLAAAAHQGWAANLFTLVPDLFPQKVVGSVVGLGLMFGSLTSILFSQAVGYILQMSGSYWSLFFIAGCAYLAALAIMQILIPDMKPVEVHHV